MATKQNSGTRARALPREIFNQLIGAAEDRRDGQLGGQQAPPKLARRSDRVRLRNDSEGTRKTGEVLAIGKRIISRTSAEFPWFEGLTPTQQFGYERFGVLLGAGKGPTEEADRPVIEAQVSGYCVGLVHIHDEAHTHAYVTPNEHVLQSGDSGPVEIIWQPTEEADKQDGDVQKCWLRLSSGRRRIYKTPSGGIPSRDGDTIGKAICTACYIGADDDIQEVTDDQANPVTAEVCNIFSGEIAGDAFVTVKDSDGRLIADAEDCG